MPEANVVNTPPQKRIEKYDYPTMDVDMRTLIIFPQPRIEFDSENLQSLGESLIENGMFQIPIVAVLARKEFAEYVGRINELWKTKFEVANYMPQSDGRYYVLIAGERRTRAAVLLAEQNLAPWTYKVHARVDIPVLSALFIQFAENTHVRVPADREAFSYNELYRVVKAMKPKTTLTEFARSVGRSPEAIRNALRFCELPEKVRMVVSKRQLHYSVAIELWKLQQAGVSASEIERWMFRAMLEKRKPDEFRKMISDYLAVRKMGQISLLDAMTETQMEDLARRRRKQVVEERLVPTHMEQKRYWENVVRMLSEGLLGHDESPYSSGSPARRLKALVDTIANLQPHLDSLVSEKDGEAMRKKLTEAQRSFELLTEVA